MSTDAPTGHWDELARGPLVRQSDEASGKPLSACGAGWNSFANQVDHAIRKRGGEFPEQFRKMMRKAVEEIIGELLPELVSAELGPFRKAFAELRGRLERAEAACGAKVG